MSKRLQILMDDKELRTIRQIARRNRMTVSQWVRETLHAASRREPRGGADRKLAVVRAASRHAFPAPDIEQMLAEIERGYLAPDAG